MNQIKRIIVFGSLLLPLIGLAQSVVPLMLKQERDGASVQGLTQAEFAALGDPLFRFLLKENANVTTLQGIIDQIDPTGEKRRLFVVHERIVSQKQAGASRRGVVSFTGSNDGVLLKGNVMLSITLLPDGKALDEIEAWGWDNTQARYNYYKLDGIGAAPSKLAWKFRGSSENADLLTVPERKGTCLACHTNGAPIMKELQFPWNNWHSNVGAAFKANYIDPKSTLATRWPAASAPLLQLLGGAEELEDDHLIPALKRFNESKVNNHLLREDATGNRLLTNGRLTLTGAKRLLAGLFVPTEVNLISSRDASGFHPFGNMSDFVPEKPIRLPDDFFLHTSLIFEGKGVNGLNLASAIGFRTFAQLTQDENKELVEKFRIRLNGVPGDTHFAWLVPTPSFIDTEMSARLLKLGAVTPHFLAAVLAIDLDEPLFSRKRASLLKYLPDELSFIPLSDETDPLTVPRNPESDKLTLDVIAKINADNPAKGSSADEFRALLKEPDAVKKLDTLVHAYSSRIKTALAVPATRKGELERLFNILLIRRQTMLSNPLFTPLDETGGTLLFALPALD